MDQAKRLKLSAAAFTIFWIGGMLWWSGEYNPVNIIILSVCGAVANSPNSDPDSGESAARSRPAENEDPSPQTMTTRTESGTREPMCASASHVAGSCALRAEGRLSDTVATGPFHCTAT